MSSLRSLPPERPGGGTPPVRTAAGRDSDVRDLRSPIPGLSSELKRLLMDSVAHDGHRPPLQGGPMTSSTVGPPFQGSIKIVSERDGRDRFALAALTPCQCGLRHPMIAVITASCVPNGPREWWANGMPLRPQHSQFIRPDASEKRPCHGIRHDVYKDQGVALGCLGTALWV